MPPGRKQRLYELGRGALTRIIGREVPGYVCPICLRGFEALDGLSEEHVPPESLGGSVLCLTCRECNSGAGHGIDSEMHREKRSKAFLAADGETKRATITVGAFTVRGTESLVSVLRPGVPPG